MDFCSSRISTKTIVDMYVKTRFAFLLIGSLVSMETSAQTPSEKEIDHAINRIVRLITDNYVFAPRGKAIAANLLSQHKKGRFYPVATWKFFDSVVTATLQRFSHDGHLYVRNDENMVKELRSAKPALSYEDSVEMYNYDPFYYGKDAAFKNFGFREVKVMDGNVGYIKLSEINISAKSLPTLFATMEFVSNTKALIIDLRDNGGGGSEVGSVFESFFLPKNTPLLRFASRSGETKTESTVSWLTAKKYERPLFILINNGTASAAEAFAFSLQHRKRATIVGQRSAGAANMNSWYVVNDHLFVSISTAAPTIPGTEISWEQKGIQPDQTTGPGKELETALTLCGRIAP